MFQHDLLKGQRILVTGGGSGLGKCMTRRFMELGAEAIICGRRAEVLKETAAELAEATGGASSTHSLDIRDADAVDAMIGEVFAAGPLDALLNNAAGNFIAETETLSPRAVDAVLNIVAHGSVYATLACGKRWIEMGRKGHVLSILATYAWTGAPYVVPSAMGKAAVLAMTRSLAVEWGRKGVRLNAIAPGPFPTEGAWSRLFPTPEIADKVEKDSPLGRTGRHEELENLAAYLMADGSEYMNGEVVTIDGGRWMNRASSMDFGYELTPEQWDHFRPKKG